MQEDKIRNPICKKCLRRIEYKLLKYGKHYVDSFWCKSCNVYYFRESDYFFYRKIWGNSVGNICIKDIEFAEWKKRAYYSKDISYSKRETVIGKNEVPVIEKKHILNTNEKKVTSAN